MPDIAHACIAAVGLQQCFIIAFDHQRLQYQLTSGCQLVFQAHQVRHRVPPVIEHAHGKYCVEYWQVLRHRFQCHRQHVDARLLQVVLDGFELQDEKRRGIDADDLGRPGTQHAPAVVAIAAARVEHPAALKRRDCIR